MCVCIYMYAYIDTHISKHFTYISSINVHNNLLSKYNYYTPLTGGKMEVQEGYITYPQPHIW